MKALIPIFWICLIIAAFFGWCMNIIILITETPPLAYWGGMEVMRVIGVFVAPLGAILGWI